MSHGWQRVTAVVGLAAVALGTSPAGAVEYRLQVVSLFDSGFSSFLRPGEIKDGATGPGLDHLESSLDRGEIGLGALLWDRRVQAVAAGAARAWGVTAVRPALSPGGEEGRLWDTLTWDGQPGERSVWLVAPGGRATQELYRAALRGAGPMRYVQPYNPPWKSERLTGPRFPLNAVWFYEERGTVWERLVAGSIDLGAGIALVVGANEASPFPDSAWIVLTHALTPTTYKAVLSWRQRVTEREAPALREPMR